MCVCVFFLLFWRKIEPDMFAGVCRVKEQLKDKFQSTDNLFITPRVPRREILSPNMSLSCSSPSVRPDIISLLSVLQNACRAFHDEASPPYLASAIIRVGF